MGGKPQSQKTTVKLITWTTAAAAAAAKSLQSCPTLCDPIDCSLPGSCVHGDSPGKNTGVGCHFLLQCMKVKSEGEVAQPCWTLSNPMDRSLPVSSVHGIFQARVLEWGAIAFSDAYTYAQTNFTYTTCAYTDIHIQTTQAHLHDQTHST